MTPPDGAESLPRRKNDAVRLRLPPAVEFSDLASLFHELDRRKEYRVFLDVGNVARWSTIEFRVLNNFTKAFEEHGGFVRLENASADLVALFHSFGCAGLLSDRRIRTTPR